MKSVILPIFVYLPGRYFPPFYITPLMALSGKWLSFGYIMTTFTHGLTVVDLSIKLC